MYILKFMCLLCEAILFLSQMWLIVVSYRSLSWALILGGSNFAHPLCISILKMLPAVALTCCTESSSYFEDYNLPTSYGDQMNDDISWSNYFIYSINFFIKFLPCLSSHRISRWLTVLQVTIKSQSIINCPSLSQVRFYKCFYFLTWVAGTCAPVLSHTKWLNSISSVTCPSLYSATEVTAFFFGCKFRLGNQ